MGVQSIETLEREAPQQIKSLNPVEWLVEKRLRQSQATLTDEAKLIPFLFNIRNQNQLQWSIKRAFDWTFSFLGLLAISPVLLLIALLIKLDSKGPILFKQKRVGLNGKTFYMYKFRSMHVNAEYELDKLLSANESNPVMFKMKNDPRVTRIGRIIRKFSLDEFPQLFNVLKGEMSLVGPRPPLPLEVSHYKKWHHVRFATLPGLTGFWQVNGRSNVKDFDAVVRMDFLYISNWNLLFDLKILFKTIPVVFFGKDTA